MHLSRPRRWGIAADCQCAASQSSSVRVPDNIRVRLALLEPTALLELPARVRHSVPANAVPCTPLALRPLQVAVLLWLAVREWVHVLVGRRVPVVCWVQRVLRLRVPLRAPVLAQALLPVVPDNVIRVRAASRKDR